MQVDKIWEKLTPQGKMIVFVIYLEEICLDLLVPAGRQHKLVFLGHMSYIIDWAWLG